MGEAKQRGTFLERRAEAIASEDDQMISQLRAVSNNPTASEEEKQEAKEIIEDLGGEL